MLRSCAACQTNDSQLGLLDMFYFDGISNDLEDHPWMVSILAVLTNAKVKSLMQEADGVRIGYSKPNCDQLEYESFDAVIMTTSPWSIHMMPERSRFGADLEHALRSCSFARMSKLGLRFHSRFWERTDLQLYGGQSTTDLPSRWVVYPDYGVGDSGKGAYCWKNDSDHWCLLSKAEKVKLALRDLQLLYPEVDIAKEYAGGKPTDEGYLEEAFSADWQDLFCYAPGQYLSFFPAMAKPQGDIYFAGAHLSSSFWWLQSALESSRRTVQQLALKYGIRNIDYI